MSVNNKNIAGRRVFGVRRPTINTPGAHAVLVTDHYVNVQADAIAGAQTHTLPVAGTWSGGTLWGIVMRGGGGPNTVTVAAPAGNTINGQASIVLTVVNDYLKVSAPIPGQTNYTIDSCQITPAP